MRGLVLLRALFSDGPNCSRLMLLEYFFIIPELSGAWKFVNGFLAFAAIAFLSRVVACTTTS